MATAIASFFTTALSSSWAHTLPKNNLSSQDRLGVYGPMGDQTGFYRIIKQVTDAFQGVVRSHGAQLTVEANWEDPTVNASSNQDGNQWFLYFYGGLARRKEITADAFTLVVCHELGHHLGGYAFSEAPYQWASVEGQADYFAAQVCARRIWEREIRENQEAASKVLPGDPIRRVCDPVWRGLPSRNNLCYRTLLAARALADLLKWLDRVRTTPSFNTPDRNRVAVTLDDYPTAQCRLDTYANAAVCRTEFNLGVIPGKTGAIGLNTPAAEREAFRYTCANPGIGVYTGPRPGCWFRPLTTSP